MAMDFSLIKEWKIPEGVVTKVMRGDTVLWAGLKNLLPTAKNADRTTIFNGKGYVTGKRLSSSGSESPLSDMCCSGFIFPVKPGDTVYIKNAKPKQGTASYVITYDSTNTKVANYSIPQKTDGSDWIAPGYGDARYGIIGYEDGVISIKLDSVSFGATFDAFRFSASVIDDTTIVTVNQPIK